MSKFVSRAGEKLQFGLDNFKITVKNIVCADFGASTGGFTDCLLQRGARRVYAIDTSYGELAWKLRNNPHVVVMERTNAIHVHLPKEMDLITIDVGWTKQKNIIPNALRNLKKKGKVVSLIKPHYEAPKRYLRKGKLIDERVDEILEKVKEDIKKAGGKVEKIVKSPISGGRAQNREFLALISCAT